MQVNPVSMTNQYRTNRSNIKQVKSQSFGHSMGYLQEMCKSNAERIYLKQGKEACVEYLQKLAEFKSKKLDLTDLYNEYLPEFRRCGRENVLNNIMT